jgi:hypothetical protein
MVAAGGDANLLQTAAAGADGKDLLQQKDRAPVDATRRRCNRSFLLPLVAAAVGDEEQQHKGRSLDPVVHKLLLLHRDLVAVEREFGHRDEVEDREEAPPRRLAQSRKVGL